MQRKALKDQKVPEPNAVEIFKDCHTSKRKGHRMIGDGVSTKANSELAQTSPVENILDEDWRGLIKHWSDPKYQVHYIYVIRSHVDVLFTHVPHNPIFL